MYRDEILDHYKRPRNEGRIEDGLSGEGENESCGDHTEVFLKVLEGEVDEMRHETDGCAICTAAISILSEEIQERPVDEVMSLDSDWMIEKLDIDISPMRMKCALLGLETVQEALKQESDEL